MNGEVAMRFVVFLCIVLCIVSVLCIVVVVGFILLNVEGL